MTGTGKLHLDPSHWGFKSSGCPSIFTSTQNRWHILNLGCLFSVRVPAPADCKCLLTHDREKTKMSQQHWSIEHGWRGGKEGEKMNKINFFHPQYHKGVREKDLVRSRCNSKNGIYQPPYSCNRLGYINIGQDWLYVMRQLLFIQYYVFCLDWRAH